MDQFCSRKPCLSFFFNTVQKGCQTATDILPVVEERRGGLLRGMERGGFPLGARGGPWGLPLGAGGRAHRGGGVAWAPTSAPRRRRWGGPGPVEEREGKTEGGAGEGGLARQWGPTTQAVERALPAMMRVCSVLRNLMGGLLPGGGGQGICIGEFSHSAVSCKKQSFIRAKKNVPTQPQRCVLKQVFGLQKKEKVSRWYSGLGRKAR